MKKRKRERERERKINTKKYIYIYIYFFVFIFLSLSLSLFLFFIYFFFYLSSVNSYTLICPYLWICPISGNFQFWFWFIFLQHSGSSDFLKNLWATQTSIKTCKISSEIIFICFLFSMLLLNINIFCEGYCLFFDWL